MPSARSIRLHRLAALQLVCLFAASAASASEPAPGSPRNHLAGEASPYLQLHVYNPVDWYPWGEEALSRARALDRPIFLSVGYSTCYWCHVMEKRVFSDPAIAKLMNESFINIKVDREERPDIDEVYMQATRLLTGSGGWPNSVFLTPEGKPFFAGTYFPPEDDRGRPGFPKVLKSLASRWASEREQMVARAERVAASIQNNFGGASTQSSDIEPDRLLERAVDALARSYDSQHGGFSSGTKFPSPHQLELLLAAHQRGLDPRALEMLTKTLDEMALGGIHDQLAGGFHRYSTEPTWSVPHFEKMLYDNAQLLPLYARAHRVTGRGLYRRTAEDIARYLADEMTHPQGGLYSAQDAQVDGEEGASYVWTDAEIREVLGPDLTSQLLSVYQLVPVERHASSGPGALRFRLPVEAARKRLKLADTVALIDYFAPARRQLLAQRARREQPLRDDKILASWNGLAIRGLADAGVELRRPQYVDAAARAAHFVLKRLQDEEGRLRRSYIAGQTRESATLNDYAFLADGLIALYAATGDDHWLRQAKRLADRMLADFEGPLGMGFFLSAEAGDLFVRPRVLTDGVIPSGNTMALKVLLDLSALTGDDRYLQAAERTRSALGPMFERAPQAVGTAIRALAVGPQLPAPPLARKTGTAEARPAPPLGRLPTGRDFVRPSVESVAGAPSRRRVLLEISEGWHVNANPASLDFLIPTRVELAQREAGAPRLSSVHYPTGSVFSPRFSLEPLAVYEGKVAIDVELPTKQSKDAQLELTFQVCDETTCLPPETVSLPIP